MVGKKGINTFDHALNVLLLVLSKLSMRGIVPNIDPEADLLLNETVVKLLLRTTSVQSREFVTRPDSLSRPHEQSS
jgi:hypothetical protein